MNRVFETGMELIRGIHNLEPRHQGCVLSIGNFDGFHRGHKALIAEVKAEGCRRGLPVVVMIFKPQPQEYFTNNAAPPPARLTRLRDKVKYLDAAGVDAVVCVTFNKRFAMLSAHAFVTDLLVRKLGVQFIGVGADFCFGAHRQGDYTSLQQQGKEAGFEVMSIMTHTEGGKRISSTAIREALSHDRLVEAEMLLGHPYRLSGRVVHGDALGRNMGFPTANLSLKGQHVPIHGVYAVEVYGVIDRPQPGVANIGTSPTIAGLNQRFEVHLLDVTMNLYGKYIEVVIRAKIRNEQRFASLDDLKWQISHDVVNVRDYFSLGAASIMLKSTIESRVA